MIETDISRAFHEAGFEFDTSNEPCRLVFHEEKLRKTPVFQEVWSINFPLEKLSRKRQKGKVWMD
jgi:hypothetical protein